MTALKQSGVALLGALAAISLLGAPSAFAFDEVGDTCVANDAEPDWTLIGLNPGPTSSRQPRSFLNGVITRWIVPVGPGLGPLAQQLVIFEQTDEEDARKVAESAPETAVEGLNQFASRIPIKEFQWIGLHGSEETLFCDHESQHLSGLFGGELPIGESRHYEVQVNVGTPVTAIVEPDRDGDGYGDESQDKCETSALYQGECPTVTVSATAKARKNSILITVNASSEAPVQVFGQVGWGFKPKPKGANHSKRGKRLIVGLDGGTKNVVPGYPASFVVPLPKNVKLRLSRLKPTESLKAKITVRATDLAQRLSGDHLTVKLKGQDVTP